MALSHSLSLTYILLTVYGINLVTSFKSNEPFPRKVSDVILRTLSLEIALNRKALYISG